MVSDSDMGSEESETEEGRERESMESSGMGMHEESSSAGQEEATSATPSGGKAKAKSGGRRAALRILRENVETVSKDMASFRKSHETSAKKMDKQVASLRNEVASLKSFISKENARAKGKQEVLLNRVIAKLNEKKPKAAAPAKKKPAAKKSKGKK